MSLINLLQSPRSVFRVPARDQCKRASTYRPRLEQLEDRRLLTSFSTYLGGSLGDNGAGIAVDAAGSTYVVGVTASANFPATAGTFHGGTDVFVAKLRLDGSLAWAALYGGNGYEAPAPGIALDGTGNLYLTGSTGSDDFPTTLGAFDETYNGPYSNAFVMKLDAATGAVVYSTYLAGTGGAVGYAVAVDASGNAYVTGMTDGESDFPTTAGAFQLASGGGIDGFVTKLNAAGSALLYSTYLGGNDSEIYGGHGIAVDGSGNAYVTGLTASTDFPTTPGAFHTTYGGGFRDAFVTKLNATGSALVYSTYLGGADDDWGLGIAVDAPGNAYVTGLTYSTDFPTSVGTFDTTANGGTEAFVTKLNGAGSALIYSTYLGGAGYDSVDSIAVDGSGNVYLNGQTTSTEFPTTTDAFDTTANGSADAFVTKLNAAGSGLVYSTYLGGGGGWESGAGIAVDGSGNVYVTGYTESADFPTTTGAFDTTANGNSDAFVTKLMLSGFSTYLGASGYDVGEDVAVDAAGNSYVVGWTDSASFPTTAGAWDETYNGGGADVFVTKLSPGGVLVWATYLGGSNSDSGQAITVDGSGNVYLTGFTYSTDFPTTAGAFDQTANGGADAFVAKLNSDGTLVYSTYLGGSGFDQGLGIAIDTSGNAYVTGTTESTDLPTTAGAFDATANGTGDTFVTKMNSDGSALFYSTYFGGSGYDWGYGIAVDAAGNAYVTGDVESTDFPTTAGAFQTVHSGSYFDAFVTKLNAAGSGLVYSTYLGHARGSGITLNASGEVFVTGAAEAGFPTTAGAFDTTLNGSWDAFVTKLNAAGSALGYSTYLGGGDVDAGYDIAQDGSGNVYLSGYTDSTDFPTTAEAFQTSSAGGDDGFVTKLNATGSALVYSTYLGGSGGDIGRGVAVGGSSNVYVTGQTTSADFPTTAGAFDTTHNGGIMDAFVTKLVIGGGGAAANPVADAGGPYSFDEGTTSVILDGSDSRGTIVSFEWDLDYDGITFVGSVTGAQVLYVPNADGPFTVMIALRVGDDLGNWDIDVAPLVVNNVAPTITNVTNNGPKDEGSSVTVTVTATDPAGTNDALQYAFDFDNNGSYEVGPQWSSSASTIYLDNGSYVVNVRVTDDDGGSTTSSTTVVVNNVAPTITNVTNNGPINESASATVTVTATDAADGNDPLLYEFDFNNDLVFEVAPQPSGQVSATFTDNGSYIVNVRVTDGDGGSATSSTTVVVNNVGPTITSVTNSGPINETASATVTVTATDSAGVNDPLLYEFDFDNDFVFEVAPQAGSQAIANFPDNGSYIVNVRVTDGDGGSTTSSTTVVVNNVGPAITSVSNSGPVTEAASATVTVNATDPAGVNDPLSYAFDFDNNGTFEVGPQAGNAASGVFANSGTFTVNVRVTDGDGGSTTSSTAVIVTNVVPAAAVSGPTNGVAGQPRAFTVGGDDISPADDAAGFTFAINWGDGSGVQSVPATPTNGPGVRVSHIFTSPGPYIVTVTATDKDSGVSSAVTHAITIVNVEMQGDTLAIGGGAFNDKIKVSPNISAGNVKLKMNRALRLFTGVTRVEAYGQGGDDKISLSAALTLPATIFGGDGNDKLKGGNGPNRIVGGPGNDKLTGGLVRDLLIGGAGNDNLKGMFGDDILISGTTSYDADPATLAAVMAEWTSGSDYDTRIAHLTGTQASGLNGTSLLNATTVQDDAAIDKLTGGTESDWYFVLQGGGLAADIIKGLIVGEEVTAL